MGLRNARVFHLGKVGRITDGPDAGRFIRITALPGKKNQLDSYLAEIAADEAFTEVVGDQYFGEIEEVAEFVGELDATIDWAC